VAGFELIGDSIDAYSDRLDLFLDGLLLRKAEGTLSLEDIKQHLQANWRLEIIPGLKDFQFITSDHPSVFMTCNNPPNPNNPLQLIFLALDPSNIAVAFDRRFMTVERKTAEADDVILFNVCQVKNSTKFVYSSVEFTASDLMFSSKLFAQKERSFSEVTSRGWKLPLTYLSPRDQFSFMRMKPPHA
jgi:Protein of unknown function (DUF4238)